MVFSNNLLMGAAGQSTGYEIDQSVRFNDLDSAFLARTPDASNRKTWTWSAWVKRANLFNGSVPQILLSAGDGGNNDFVVQFGQTNDTLRISDYIGGTASNLIPTQLFRDVGAWYHFVLAYDTTQGTAANRIKLYLNGSQVTAFGTEVYPSQNTDMVINSAIPHNIGRGAYSSNGYFSGYMAEINFVDGTALAPTAFGETNDDGVWVPIAYAGAYGTEGYLIDGRDSSDLGDDESGNGNDYSSSGLAAADQMGDTPTTNWCTWNNIDTSFNNNVTSDGNLVITTASPGYTRFQLGTIGVSSGKWEWKWTPTASLSDGGIGVDDGTSQAATGASNGAINSQSANGFIYRSGGTKLVGGTASSYGATFAADDVIRCQIDLDASTPTIEFFKNDASQGSINMNAGVTYFPCQFSADASLVTVVDFGQVSFTAASGFNLLNTTNLATPTIKDGSAHFQPTLYTGTSSALEVDQSGNSTFTPDLAWIKSRSGASNQVWIDSVRGVSEQLYSNAAAAEATAADGLTSFDADGFTLGDDSGDYVNIASANMVGWQWKANGSGSSNTDGSINTNKTSANATAGFSIIEWSGTGANGTIGHGLGIQPSLYIVKNTATTNSWMVGSTLYANTKFLILNALDALDTAAAVWNSTYPTSSVINLGSNVASNGSGTNNMICYAFAEIPSYSSIGSFIGNGSTDGPFIFTDFKPALIIFKNSGNGNNWDMMDTQRSPINPVDQDLQPSTSSAETTPGNQIDYLSNGFKLRTATANLNNNGNTIIYIAFAENPFGGDGVAPATAR